MIRKHDPELLRALGFVIAERRLAINMTQQELADLIGVYRTYLSEIEQGKRNVSIGTLHTVADALELSAAELIKQADTIFRFYKTKKRGSKSCL